MTPIRTVLHPTDFSEHAAAAWRLAGSLARDHGARLLALHVATPPPLVTYGELENALQGPSGYRRELETCLRSACPADAAARVDYHLEQGDPAGAIVRAAKEYGCDLIVMGTHGRTGLGRLLLGSVAEQVVRKAPCPVLTLSRPAARGP
jgi:nucleotide-binding universal stress UspA family protein